MIFKTILLVTMFLGSNVFAQGVCGTHSPTSSEYQFLVNYVANLPILKNAGTTCIPIRLHIVRETNGTGGVSLDDVHEGVAYLNAYYLPAGIEFYFCGTSPNFINNSQFYDFQNTEENALAAAAGETNNAINMYFVDEIDNTGGLSYTAGYAYTPANSVVTTRIVMRNANVAEGSTIVHEMGHHFALLHTFETSQFFVPGMGLVGGPELVNGNNCTTAGDIICDTPADPGFTGTNINLACQYTGTATDADGALYTPSIDNVMSYYPSQCQNPFVLTTGQIARIQQGLTTRQGHTAYDMSCSASSVTDPSGLSASFVGATAVLNWTDNSTNETGFFIERSEVSATAGFVTFGGFGVGSNITTFTDNSILVANSYYYRVKASNDGCNDYSNVVQIGGTVPCSILAITAGNPSACDPTTNTYSVDVTVTYTNAPAGTIDINGQTFNVGTNPQTETLTGLTANGNNVGVTAFFTNATPCSFTNNSAFTAPVNCTPAPCAITSIAAFAQFPCDPNTNTYNQELIITYNNAPGGTINVNGQTFAVSTSPQNVVLIGLIADGNSTNVTAFFTNQTTCMFTDNNTFTAPVNCSPACSISSITAGVQSACDSTTNTFTQEVTLTYINPSAANIVINGQTFAISTSPQTFILTALIADGNSIDVNAQFTSGSFCGLTVNGLFTAPISCASTCTIGDVNAILDGDTLDYCPGTVINLLTDSTEVVPAGESYVWVFINATDTVFISTGGSYSGDVNAALVAGGSAPIPFGSYVVYALLTENNGADICGFTPGEFYVNVLDSANAICLNAPLCSAGDVAANLLATTVDYCPGATIFLTTDGTENVLANEDYLWVFINATDTAFVNVGPAYTGDINADLIAAGGTAIPPGIYTVFGLTTESGGTLTCDLTPGDFTVNVLTAADPACQNPCAIIGISTGIQSLCDPATNTYGQELLITYTNEPGGTLNVNGQIFLITGSPQSIVLAGLLADGNPLTVFAFFTNSTSCNYTENNLFTAPVGCAPVPCNISEITAGSQSSCDSNTNSYSQNVTIAYSNAPGGTINVNAQVFPVTTSPQTITLTGLVANGNPVSVNAFFTNSTACDFNLISAFNAALPCATLSVDDSLVVMMYPNGAGTLFVGNDVITNTPFTGYYPTNALLDISAIPNNNGVFDFWRLNNQSLIDFSPSTEFLFVTQDTLFAYFNGAVGINELSSSFKDFKVYPTLVNDKLTFEFTPLISANLKVELFALDGKRAATLINGNYEAGLAVRESYTIDLAAGMYFLKGSTAKDSFSTRVIVQ
ncbi:MAG: hypothetical protein ACI9O4_000172 [Chitinophagales bacterium]|jgi:hypothetical protein